MKLVVFPNESQANQNCCTSEQCGPCKTCGIEQADCSSQDICVLDPGYSAAAVLTIAAILAGYLYKRQLRIKAIKELRQTAAKANNQL